jgi:hypothetical protein
MMGKKVRTTLTIDGEVLKTAMEIGINVSQFCENALREAIQKLKNPSQATNGKKRFLGEASLAKEGSWWAGPDLNRRPSARQADVLTELDYRPPELVYFRFRYIATSSFSL